MLNQVILVGRLGKDPETTSTQSGTVICKFSLATSEVYYDKNTKFKIGDVVDYHAIIGGPVTSTGHTIKNIGKIGKMFEDPGAWLSNKRGFVSMAALYLTSDRNRGEEEKLEPK